MAGLDATPKMVAPSSDTEDVANPVAGAGAAGATSLDEFGNEQVVFKRLPCMLYPHDAFKKWWDLIIVFLLMYVGISVPYYIGLGIEPEGVFRMFNIVLDVIFFMDLFFNFRSPFEGEDKVIIDDPTEIVRNYMKGWFWIDFPTCVPFGELAKLWMKPGEESDLGTMKLLRVVRLVRLAKGLRVLKMMKVDIFKTIMETIGIGVSVKYYGIAMVKLTMLLLVLAHFNACAWYYAAHDTLYDPGMPYDMSKETWGNKYSNYDRYIAALYWAVQSMTTVGYGDMTASTSRQRLLSIITMYGGATVFGYIVGNMANILSLRNASKKLYNQKMDVLEEFMEDINVPEELRARVRSHYKIRYENNKVFDEARILNELPGSLGIELALHIRADLIKCTPILRDNHKTFAASIISHGKITVEQAGELVIRAGDVARNMYFMESGIAEVLMTIDGVDRTVGQIREGDCFGSIGCMITDKHPISVVCQLSCRLLEISKEEFNATIANHQDVAEQFINGANKKLQQYKTNSKREKWESSGGNMQYEIIVATGDETGGGTDVAVLLTLVGDAGTSDPINLHTLRDTSEGAAKLFGRAQMDKFQCIIKDVGEIQSIKIGFSSGRDAWLLDWVLVDIPGQATWRFPCNKWLREGDSYVDLTPVHGNSGDGSVTGVKAGAVAVANSSEDVADNLLDDKDDDPTDSKPSVNRLSQRLDGIELAITRVLNALPDIAE